MRCGKISPTPQLRVNWLVSHGIQLMHPGGVCLRFLTVPLLLLLLLLACFACLVTGDDVHAASYACAYPGEGDMTTDR